MMEKQAELLAGSHDRLPEENFPGACVPHEDPSSLAIFMVFLYCRADLTSIFCAV
jgi:hypothetical protein